MDSTQIFFTMQTSVADLYESATISMPAQEFDLSASIFLAVDKACNAADSLFLTLHSSFENVIFHVCEGFENFSVSVCAGVKNVYGKVRSMWRERIAPKHFPKIARHSAILVMRT